MFKGTTKNFITLKDFLPEKHAFKRGPFGSALKKAFFVKSGYKVYEQKNAIKKNNNIGSYYINNEKYKELKAFSVEEGDIIVSCSGTVGETYIIPKDSQVGVINQALLRIRTNKNVSNVFFNYMLNSNYMRKKFLEQSQGGVVKNLVSMAIFKKIEIPNFDKKEQDKIVSILGNQQSLIDSYKEKLSLLKEQESYYQDELLSGRLRVRLTNDSIDYVTEKGWYANEDIVEGFEKEFEEWISIDYKDKVEFYKEAELTSENIDNINKIRSENWKVSKIEDLCNITTGKLNANAKVDNGKYRFYTCAKDYSFIDCYTHDTEAIFISGNGSQLGHINHYKGKFNAYQRTYILKDFKINTSFLKKYLDINLKNRIKNEVRSANIPYLVIDVISKMKIIVPENFIEIYLINVFLELFNDQENEIKNKIKIEEEKMEYLMDELLSGRIRVK